MSRRDAAILLLAGLFSSLWCLSTAHELGATFDEPFYLEGGLDFWRGEGPGKLLRAGTMPLPVQVQTFPLAVAEWTTGQRWTLPDDVPTMLIVARLGTLPFWWLLLLYGWRLGHALGGPGAGQLAVILLALEPSLLAHSGLATTDVALTACLLVFLYHFRAGREQSWPERIGLPALLFGIALVAKASTLTFAPLLMLAVEIERLNREGRWGELWAAPWRTWAGSLWRWTRPLRVDGLAIVTLGLLVGVLLAGTNGEPLPRLEKNLAWLTKEHPLHRPLRLAGELPLWPNAFYVLWYQVKHNLIGHATYLLGHEHARALWFYFPVLLTMKLSLGVLILLGLGLALPGPRWNLALGTAALLFVFSVQCRVQIGIRFLLPLIALLLIGLAVRWSALLAAGSASQPRLVSGLVAALLLGLALETGLQWPDPLRFINVAWGGTETGYRLVSDSNYDWGQGLPELAAWQGDDPQPLALWYFGTDPRYPHWPRYDPKYDGLDSPRIQGRRLAVGVSLLHGGYTSTPAERELKQRLARSTPIARTRTFLIYERVEP